jgi:ATP-dependent Clp protease ATP-binding subunit ClpA
VKAIDSEALQTLEEELKQTSAAHKLICYAVHAPLLDLHSGQEEVIHEIVRTYPIYPAGLSLEGRPIGNFLFLGPTGTGKARTVEATAEALLGNPRAILKMDCAEFQHRHEIAKLIESLHHGYPGHREIYPMFAQEVLNRYHTDSLKLSFVLFDEIEKASSPTRGNSNCTPTLATKVSRAGIQAVRRKFTPEFLNRLATEGVAAA